MNKETFVALIVWGILGAMTLATVTGIGYLLYELVKWFYNIVA